MGRQIPDSVKTALVMTIIVVAYFVFSALFRGEPSSAVESVETPPVRVVAQTIEENRQQQTVELRGRTKALRMATLRAETAGQVDRADVAEGDFVNTGDVLCRITPGVRGVGLAEAQAAFDKAKLDYQAAQDLARQGYQSDAAVAAAKAAFDMAEANLTRARVDLSKTSITAPFAGVVQERHVEVGDLLSIGTPCATIAQLDPIAISGSVSEQEVIRIDPGIAAIVTVSTGDILDAEVTKVAATASAATRTYDIELQAPNPNALPDGLTAAAKIDLGETPAHLVPRNALLRNDTGILGVRIVEPGMSATATGRVVFVPVAILTDAADGIWVTGLQGTVQLITRGQDYVREGQEVEIALPGTTLRSG